MQHLIIYSSAVQDSVAGVLFYCLYATISIDLKFRRPSLHTSTSAVKMADLLNNGAAQMGQFPLEQWFYEMPPCTRYWTTATVIASVLVQCKVLTPFQLFYTFRAVYYKSQVSKEETQILYRLTVLVLAHPYDIHLLRASLS